MTEANPVDPQKIVDKWNARLANQAGHGSFLRHLDGNLLNTAKTNLECVHPFDAFWAMHHNLGWTVDWSVGLTEDEQAFVRDNLWCFCSKYIEEMELDTAAIEEEMQGLSERGDAAMEAGDFNAALALYQEADEVRARAVFGSRPVLESAGTDSNSSTTLSSCSKGSNGESSSKPQHGRRSVEASERISILSTPSRRRQPDGAPTKREEVAARIAERNAAPGH
uniref:Uncharacterized protein n=1 Tax=Haptolina brevifila TaxID=156173 RepID=A0A7S2MYT2_9EUKA